MADSRSLGILGFVFGGVTAGVLSAADCACAGVASGPPRAVARTVARPVTINATVPTDHCFLFIRLSSCSRRRATPSSRKLRRDGSWKPSGFGKQLKEVD